MKLRKSKQKKKSMKKSMKLNKNKKTKNRTIRKIMKKRIIGGDEVNITTPIISVDNQKNKDDATKKIQMFMVSKKDKIKALFLKTICSDSGLCIAFGIESDNIIKFFKYFITGEYVTPPIIRIGQKSENGFVNSITYEREGYKANTILKSTIDNKSDNLFYEYLVGKYINTWTKIYPCFCETYGLFKYNTEEDWEYVKNTESIDDNIIQTRLTYLKDPTIQESCKNAKYMALLIQYINNAKTLFQKMTDKTDLYFRYDLLYILYQIYMPLSMLADNFTHYDLHANNILIYEPIQNKYIQYYYHSMDEENYPITEFKSRFIVKIIDYGRAYFNDKTTNSLQIYNEVCNTPDCGGTACGVDNGYKRLVPERYPGSRSYIISQKRNISHDLRLLNFIKQSNYPVCPELKTTLDHLNYETPHGTRENENDNPEQINNVHDAFAALDQIIHMDKWKKVNDHMYSKMNKIGDLHIYEDGRPMEFIKK